MIGHFFSRPRFCCSACLKTGMETYHPVEAKTNVQKMFWSKKEVSGLANELMHLKYERKYLVIQMFRRGMRRPLAIFFSL